MKKRLNLLKLILVNIETANNKESYLVISGIKFQLNDWCKSNMDKVERVIDNYGKRAKNAAEDNGADYKAISHAVRVILQVEEILKTGKLQFPLKEAEFIKSIKYKTTEMSFEEIISWIEIKIKEIEEVLVPNSNLQEKVNQHHLAKGNQILYSDSEWSNEYVYTYTKGGNASNITQLATPEITSYDGISIYWTNIANADKYYVKVNGTEYTTYENYYTVSFTQNETFTFTVKAVSNHSDYEESEWAEVRSFEYIKGQTGGTFLQTGIGYTVDVRLQPGDPGTGIQRAE